jgi:hypothetical protein
LGVAVGGTSVTVGDGNCDQVGATLCGDWTGAAGARVGAGGFGPHPDSARHRLKTKIAVRDGLLFIELLYIAPALLSDRP